VGDERVTLLIRLLIEHGSLAKEWFLGLRKEKRVYRNGSKEELTTRLGEHAGVLLGWERKG
jgi:hypothetical protein